MGKMILCSGRQASIPFVFTLSKIAVYSIEELCYYLYHNIYEISEDIFCKRLVDWLGEDIEMPAVGLKLQKMMDGNSSLKDIVVTLLCSCDYYSEGEIKKLVEVLDSIHHLPYIGKQKIKADNFLKYKKYSLAIREYEKILGGGIAINLSTLEYGNVLHNLSIAYSKTGSCHEAAIGFKQAYSRNHNKESLRQYLILLLLSNELDAFHREVIQMGVDIELAKGYQDEVEVAMEEVKNRTDYKNIHRIVEEEKQTKDETIERLSEWTINWKRQYREEIRSTM